jgi:hypothetical protein
MMRYRASKTDCDVCPLKPRCTPKESGRKILRSIHEGARDLARSIARTDAFATSLRQRKKVEMLFAHLKRILKLDRLRLRGPNGAGTNSSWPPPPRTSGSSPSSPPDRLEAGVGASNNPIPSACRVDFFNEIGPLRTFGSGECGTAPSLK